MKLLLIEDEQALSQTIIRFLSQQGHVCELATTYQQGQEKIGVYTYDCVLIDLMLPGGSGIDLLRLLKKDHNHTGAIILSAKDSLDDKLLGLDLGADDYLPKPFHLSELNSRINSLLRRLKFKGTARLEIGALQIDTDARVVYVHEHALELNRKEYDLLLLFATNPNRVIKKSALAEHIWGDQSDQVDSYDFIYSQIKNLRRRFSQVGYELAIQTVYGIGYKFTPTDQPAIPS
ncbi:MULTISPECIES: response regulator transcription factor [Spirosoma]|uniref:Response regulator transcription factor n=1 Tax=Spirosoma liriopis TaxID=2937440 RepID=A0ABT0HUX7_9BACT|nr:MULTISPECIES: response regulator transcription factor [Spirosoma]MCK8495990.1 response regulator transcription factor [Spirosoma liriopis]UHG94911.1 response regulator transcription factor [Spirosoma oryzicola]